MCSTARADGRKFKTVHAYASSACITKTNARNTHNVHCAQASITHTLVQPFCNLTFAIELCINCLPDCNKPVAPVKLSLHADAHDGKCAELFGLPVAHHIAVLQGCLEAVLVERVDSIRLTSMEPAGDVMVFPAPSLNGAMKTTVAAHRQLS